MDNSSIPLHPAPWNLTGNGYILLYRFSKAFAEKYGFLNTNPSGNFTGGLGTVMLVNYDKSDVGPYRELLFIPGVYSYPWGKHRSISKIYVSTNDSVVNGQNNWGIPKELANFVTETKNGEETVKITVAGKQAATFTFSKPLPMSIPTTTKLVPEGLRTLSQDWAGKSLLTAPSAKGISKICRLKSVHCDAELFPPLQDCTPLSVIKIPNFNMVFPPAKVAGE